MKNTINISLDLSTFESYGEEGRLIGTVCLNGQIHLHAEAIAVKSVRGLQLPINEDLYSNLEAYHTANGSSDSEGFETIRHAGKDWVVCLVPFAK